MKNKAKHVEPLHPQPNHDAPISRLSTTVQYLEHIQH